MEYLKRMTAFKKLDDAQRENFRERARAMFVVAVWVTLFALFFAYSVKHSNDLPTKTEPRLPASSAKFF